MIPRLVFFDLEGTLFRIPSYSSNKGVALSAWTVLAERLGPACLQEEEESKLAWEAGKFRSYLDWMESSIAVLIRHGLTREIFFKVINELEETPGIRVAAQRLHEMGTKLAIISGGFKQAADRAQLAMGAQHALAACELFFDEKGGPVRHWNLLPSDFLGKTDFMRLMIREYGISPSQCVFVGDGPNDVHLAQEVGVSIAYNAHEKLRATSTYALTGSGANEDFSRVVDLILKH